MRLPCPSRRTTRKHWITGTGWARRSAARSIPTNRACSTNYLGEARYLAGWEGVAAWPLFEKAYNLLLDTGRDPILPWHWRSLCLDYAYRPSANFSD